MLLQSIPLSSLSSREVYLTVSINLDYTPKYCPSADMTVVATDELTNAERRVVAHINLPAKLIADQLNISANTVKKHIQNAKTKTGSKSSRELALWAERNKPVTKFYLNE